MLLAVWYYHSEEGRRFLEARDLRVLLVATGVVAAIALLRTRPKLSHEVPWWKAIALALTGTTLATALWLGVDWVRGEGWIFELLRELPELHENVIRYSVLILAVWLGWSIAFFEGLRRIASRRQTATL